MNIKSRETSDKHTDRQTEKQDRRASGARRTDRQDRLVVWLVEQYIQINKQTGHRQTDRQTETDRQSTYKYICFLYRIIQPEEHPSVRIVTHDIDAPHGVLARPRG